MNDSTTKTGLYIVIGGSAAGISGTLISYDKDTHQVTLRVDDDTILITHEKNIKEGI